MQKEDVEKLQAELRVATDTGEATGSFGIAAWGLDWRVALARLAVGIPLAWGIWITLEKALVLFQ